MRAGIRNGIRRLGFCDSALFVLTCGWIIIGVSGNYIRVHGLTAKQSWTVLAMMIQILWMIVMAAIAGVIVYSVIRQQRSPADYGFSLKRGGLASLAVLAVIHVCLVISGKFVLSATGSFYLLIVFGAFMEELVFRAIAIDKFILLMDGIKAKAFWAILASSALFSILHIPSKSSAELLGIFNSSLIMGYAYYKLRSILLPAWIHSASNAGYLGGVLIAALYCLISIVDCTVGSRKKQTPRSAVASGTT